MKWLKKKIRDIKEEYIDRVVDIFKHNKKYVSMLMAGEVAGGIIGAIAGGTISMNFANGFASSFLLYVLTMFASGVAGIVLADCIASRMYKWNEC